MKMEMVDDGIRKQNIPEGKDLDKFFDPGPWRQDCKSSEGKMPKLTAMRPIWFEFRLASQ